MEQKSPAHAYRQAVACYTGVGIDRLRRNWRYLRLPDNAVPFYGAVLAVTTTAIGGAVLGNTFGNTFIQSLPLSPNEKMIAMGIATGGGFTLGMGMGIYGQMYLVEKSTGFTEWKEAQITTSLIKVVKSRFSKDPVWSCLVCAVSKKPLLIPVRDPFGILYEHEIVIKHINPSTNLIKTPLKTPSFHKDKLSTDLELSVVILKRIKHLMTQELKACQEDPETHQLLLGEKDLLEQAIKVQYENARLQVEKRRQDEIVTEDTYEKEISEFKHLFGRGPKQDLDWSRDWLSILETRWDKFRLRPLCSFKQDSENSNF